MKKYFSTDSLFGLFLIGVGVALTSKEISNILDNNNLTFKKDKR